MTDFTVTIHCPVSTRQTIADALTCAQVRHQMLMSCGLSPLPTDGETYENAKNAAWSLLFDGIHSVPNGYKMYTGH